MKNSTSVTYPYVLIRLFMAYAVIGDLLKHAASESSSSESESD